METLALAARLVAVAVAVRVHDVAPPEDAGHGAAHPGVVEHLRDLRDQRQDVVAEVPVGLEHLLDPAVDAGVESRRQVGLDDGVAVDEKPPHGLVIEQVIRSHHQLRSPL